MVARQSRRWLQLKWGSAQRLGICPLFYCRDMTLNPPNQSLGPVMNSISSPETLAAAASSVNEDPASIRQSAQERARTQGLRYAGELVPTEAWALVASGAADLLDVRTVEERHFVGQVPGSRHVAWATGTSMARNPRFVREVEAKVPKDRPVVLLCRSGKRSLAAAEALTAAGFVEVYNISEGFEGDLDAEGHRGSLGGWRRHGLPWVQD